MKELGIDYQAIADEMHAEYEARKAAERAYKQQQRIDELRAESPDAIDIDSVDFTYDDDDYVPESRKEAEQIPSAAPNANQEAPAENEKDVEEMEEAAQLPRKNVNPWLNVGNRVTHPNSNLQLKLLQRSHPARKMIINTAIKTKSRKNVNRCLRKNQLTLPCSLFILKTNLQRLKRMNSKKNSLQAGMRMLITKNMMNIMMMNIRAI